MKKFLILFVLAFGLLSFSSSEKLNDSNSNVFTMCCSIQVTYLGEPAGAITKCIAGDGVEAGRLACILAKDAAKKFIDEGNN